MNTVVVHNAYQDLRPFVESLPQTFSHSGEIIYNGRNQIRVVRLPDGRLLNIKRFAIPCLFNRLIYTFIRQPKPVRAYNNAIRLLHSNVTTPQPIGYFIATRNGLLSESYLITLHCPFSHRFYEFGEEPIEGKEHILQAFAHFTADLHEKGIYHKDYSPGNILFEEQNGQVSFCIIDINRMSFGKVSREKGCANFARLWGNTRAMRLIAREYANSRGFDPHWCEKSVVKHWHRFWAHKTKLYPNYD